MKILKGIGTFFIVIFGGVFLFISLQSEVLPEGRSGDEAEEIANQMLLSINDSAWKQTGAVSWGYRGHWFIWDRQRHLAEVKFSGNEVLIDINERKGFIVKTEQVLSENERVELCEKAWKLWVNDSFWLNAVSKCKDPGTTRSLVRLNDGRKGLKISYSTGGATPGDSYVWILDEQNRPISWKLWVSIIPVKGLEVSWDDWIQLETGAWVATAHNGITSLPIREPKGYGSLMEMTNGVDIFAPLKMTNVSF